MKLSITSAVLALAAATSVSAARDCSYKGSTKDIGCDKTPQRMHVTFSSKPAGGKFAKREYNLHANGGRLWINKPTETLCPGYVPACKTNKYKTKDTTIFDYGPGGSSVFMNVNPARDFHERQQALYMDKKTGIIHYGAVGKRLPDGAEQDIRAILLGDSLWLCTPPNEQYKAYAIYQLDGNKGVPEVANTVGVTCEKTKLTYTPAPKAVAPYNYAL